MTNRRNRVLTVADKLDVRTILVCLGRAMQREEMEALRAKASRMEEAMTSQGGPEDWERRSLDGCRVRMEQLKEELNTSKK